MMGSYMFRYLEIKFIRAKRVEMFATAADFPLFLLVLKYFLPQLPSQVGVAMFSTGNFKNSVGTLIEETDPQSSTFKSTIPLRYASTI